MLFNEYPPIEAYRRLSTLLFWIENKIDFINQICLSNYITIKISRKKKQIIAPKLIPESNCQNEENEENEIFDFSIWFNFDEE